MLLCSACCIFLTLSLHLRSSLSWDLDEPFDDDARDDTVNDNDGFVGDDLDGDSFADNEHHNQNEVCMCDGNKDSFIKDLQDNDGLGPGNCVSVARAIDCFDDDSDGDDDMFRADTSPSAPIPGNSSSFACLLMGSSDDDDKPIDDDGGCDNP